MPPPLELAVMKLEPVVLDHIVAKRREKRKKCKRGEEAEAPVNAQTEADNSQNCYRFAS